MASALYTASAGFPIEEAVPLAMEVSGVRKASVLQGRRRIRFQPQTGTTAGPGSIIQFLLSDSTGLIDCNSATVSFTYAISSEVGTGFTLVMDDGPAMIRRAQTSINGQLLEDVDNAHRAFNAELAASSTLDFYRTEGSFLNLWKFNKDQVGNGVIYASNPAGVPAGAPASCNGADRRLHDVISTLAEVSQQQRGAVSGAVGAAGGIQVSLPLGLIMPAWRSEKYWPLRNMGELVISLTTAQPNECMWQNSGVANLATQPNYSLTDIFLEVDVVVPHPMYAALLDRVVQNDGEPGLVIPVDTRLVSQGQSIGAGNAESSVIVSRATNNLRRAVIVNQPTAGIAALSYPSISCFGDFGFQSLQFRCGSLYFPSQPLTSHARAAMATYAAYGQPAQVGKNGIFNLKSFSQTTASNYFTLPAGTVALSATLPTLPAGTLNGTLTAAAAGTVSARDLFADQKVLAYCFDSYKGTSDPLDFDGISVLGQAGSQLVSVLRVAPTEPITPTVILDATKYIQLKNGTLDIKGA
jgi:hypothetical protein